MWYEVYYSDVRNMWDVYRVTGNGQHYLMIKTFKTKKGAENYTRRQGRPVKWG